MYCNKLDIAYNKTLTNEYNCVSNSEVGLLLQ